MPHTLFLTDGTNPISLTTAGVMLKHFVPQTAKKLQQSRGIDDYDDVAEAIEIMLYGSTTDDVQLLHSRIEAMLDRAGDDYDARIYLLYQPIGDAYQWRAEIRSGSIVLADNAMTTYGQNKIEARIVLTRRGVWEGQRLEAPLSTLFNSVVGTGGRVLATGGYRNYATIPAGAVLGSLRTVAEMQIINDTGGVLQPRQIYVAATGSLSDVSSFDHILEAENATGGTAIAGGATASNGQLLQLDFVTDALVTWTLSQQAVFALGGREMRLYARFNWYPGGSIYVKPIVPGIALPGAEVRLPQPQREFVDLGSIRLPTNRFGSPGSTTLQLVFRASSSTLIELDYVQLTLANPGIRVIDYLGGDLNAGERIYDYATDETAWTLNGVLQTADVAVSGSPVWLYPSRYAQRIYLMTDAGFQAPVNKTYNLRVYYRPRRLTI